MKYHWTFFDFWLGTYDCVLRCFVCLILSLLAVDATGGSICGGRIVINKTTSISSPGYPEVSLPGVDCTWWIESSTGKSIIVRGNHLDFGSEIKDDCSKGILQIFNGCDDKERFLVERICLNMQQIERQSILWISSGPCVTIKFSSQQGRKNKLSLAVEETEASCGAILSKTNSNHTFTGSLPANPSIHNKCVWIIGVQKGNIELVFQDKFHVTSLQKDCRENYVLVQDGRYSTSPTLGKFCGTSRPYPVYSGGQYLRVTLHSSNTGVNMDHFFKAQYNLINAKPSLQTRSDCKDGDIFLKDPNGGSFQTPRYPVQYPRDLNCIWKIEVGQNNKIILRFRDFDVEGDSQDCPDDSDYAKVYNGLASWSPIIGRYCGKETPSSITSKANVLRIEFRSNAQYAGRGFHAVYTVQSEEKAEDRRTHLTGIMIGATCGIIFIVLCFLAVVHTRKHRFQRAHSRPSELTSTASFDVHEANAPPSYATVMASPELFPSNARQQGRSYAGVPHLHREISHLLGDPDSEDEEPPPYPGLPPRDGVVEFCFGDPSTERRRSNSKERHLSESEQPSCQISAVWYRRPPSSNSRELDTTLHNNRGLNTLSGRNSKDSPRPVLERMDTDV